MSPRWSLDPVHDAGDVCLCHAGRQRFLPAKQANHDKTMGGAERTRLESQSTTKHTLAVWAPLFTVYCIVLLPLEGP